eukprot:5173557-Prymnesium_polylepis.1
MKQPRVVACAVWRRDPVSRVCAVWVGMGVERLTEGGVGGWRPKPEVAEAGVSIRSISAAGAGTARCATAAAAPCRPPMTPPASAGELRAEQRTVRHVTRDLDPGLLADFTLSHW